MKAAELAARWWADRLKTGDREKFAAALQPMIERALADRETVFIAVDYDPCAMLLDALHAIGVPCSGFMWSAEGILPLKTSLVVTAQRLEPKEGYGNWTAPIEVEP